MGTLYCQSGRPRIEGTDWDTVHPSPTRPMFWTAHADTLCEPCKTRLYGDIGLDPEGNEPGAVFEESWDYVPACGECGLMFVGTPLTRDGEHYIADWLGERFGEIAPDLRADLLDAYGLGIVRAWTSCGFADDVCGSATEGAGYAALHRLDDGTLWVLHTSPSGFEDAEELDGEADWADLCEELEGAQS